MEQNMSTPESDVEALMNAFIPFGRQMLEKNSEFFPYGGAMSPEGEITFVAGYDGNNRPLSGDIIDVLKDGFRKAAKQNKYKATGIFFDAKVLPPGKKEKTDALAIALDHQDNYSIMVFIPYKLKSSKLLKRTTVEFDELYFITGANDIFTL
jgi:hypothetical protein